MNFTKCARWATLAFVLGLIVGCGVMALAPLALAVTPEVTARNDYTGNGSTTVFPYTFRVLSASDIEVIVDGTTKTINTHYSVSGVGGSGGGSVTLFTAPANNIRVNLLRRQPASQLSVYQQNEAFPAARINNDFDKAAMQAQMQAEQLNRSLHVSKYVYPFNTEVDVTGQGGKCFGVNSAATATVMRDCSGGGGGGDPLPADNVTGTGSLGSNAVFSGTFTITEDATHKTVTTLTRAGIQAAHDALGAGGVLYIPAGTPTLDATTITITKAVTIQCAGPSATMLTGTAAVMFTITSTSPVTIKDCGMTPAAGTVAIRRSSVTEVLNALLLDNVRILGGAKGVDVVTNSLQNKIVNSVLLAQTDCAICLANAADFDRGDNLVANNQIEPLQFGIHFTVGGLRVIGNKIIGDHTYSIRGDLTGSGGVTVAGNDIGACSTSCVSITGVYGDVAVTGNVIGDISTAVNATLVEVVGTNNADSIARITITGNILHPYATTTIAVALTRASRAMISGNSYQGLSNTIFLAVNTISDVVSSNNLIQTILAPFQGGGLANLKIIETGFQLAFALVPSAAAEGSILNVTNVAAAAATSFPVATAGGSNGFIFRQAGAWRLVNDIAATGGSGCASPPCTVPEGGTGLTTITNHGVLLGRGASAIAPMAVGASDTVLAGVTGADPIFTTSPTVSFISVKDITSSTGASTGVFDYSVAGTAARLVARGPDTSTNSQFRFITTRSDGSNLVEAITIVGDGKVGINTTAPNANQKLHVNGDTTLGGQVTLNSWRVLQGGTVTAGAGQTSFTQDTTTISALTAFGPDTSTNGKFRIQTVRSNLTNATMVAEFGAGVQVGAPTGGDLGIGKINAKGFFKDGVEITVGGIIGSGATGQCTFWTGVSSLGGSNSCTWDNTLIGMAFTKTTSNSLPVIGITQTISGPSFTGTRAQTNLVTVTGNRTASGGDFVTANTISNQYIKTTDTSTCATSCNNLGDRTAVSVFVHTLENSGFQGTAYDHVVLREIANSSSSGERGASFAGVFVNSGGGGAVYGYNSFVGVKAGVTATSIIGNLSEINCQTADCATNAVGMHSQNINSPFGQSMKAQAAFSVSAELGVGGGFTEGEAWNYAFKLMNTAGVNRMAINNAGELEITAPIGNSTRQVLVTNTGANGANIRLVGNGATTPNKTLRVNAGVFEIYNHAYSAAIFQLDDAGGAQVPGAFNAAGGFYVGVNAGIDATLVVRCEAGTDKVRTLTYNKGILTNSGTCA